MHTTFARRSPFVVFTYSAVVAGVLAMIASPAHAVYAVLDDDLYPTAAIHAREVSREPRTESFRVPFTRASSLLGPRGRNFVEGLLHKLSTASEIRIVGILDAGSPANSERQLNTAFARANSIRSYLLSQGIPSDLIRVEVDSSLASQTSAGTSTAEIQISRISPRAALAARAHAFAAECQSQERAIPHTSRNIPSSTQAFAPSKRLVQFINQAVQSGQMESSVALQLLRSFVETDSTNASVYIQAPQQANTTPIEKPIPVASEVKVQAASVTAWEILQADGTLQNTLARWGTAANWEIHWNDVPEIKNPGYIKLPDRDFLSAAEYVLSKAKLAAKAAGIDISIKAYSNRVLVISKEVQK